MKKNKNILIVDDDSIFIFLTSKILQNSENVNHVEVLYSASDAIHYISQANQSNSLPDIILLDLNMPGMTGWDFLEQYSTLNKSFASTPKLYVVSSSIAENDKERALNYAAVKGYIAKPVTAACLRKLLE